VLARRLLKNKPYFFIATEKEAWRVSRLLLRVQLARFFNVSPFEFEGVPEGKLKELVAVVEAITEFEKESGENGV